MAILNTKQIYKTNNKTKLIEFNDKLQPNDFSEVTGQLRSTPHSKFSRIGVTMVDWTNGKKEKAIVVNYNLLPSTMKMIAQLVINNNFQEFEKTDKYSKKIGFFEQKIDPYSKDEKYNLNPVSKFNIRYQAKMGSPWTINIENGVGQCVSSKTGGIQIKYGSYKELYSVTLYLSQQEMMIAMIETKGYIEAFETAHILTMLRKREAFEKEFFQNQKNNEK